MENTLVKAKEIRPNGLWGFYGFPRCFNYKMDEDFCQKDTTRYNDKYVMLTSNWLERRGGGGRKRMLIFCIFQT